LAFPGLWYTKYIFISRFHLFLYFKSIRASVIGTSVAIFCLGFIGEFLPIGEVRSFLIDPIPLEFCMGLWLAWVFSSYERPASESTFPISVILGFAGFGLLFAAPVLVSHAGTGGLPGVQRVFAWGVPAVLVVASFLPIGLPISPGKRFLVLLGDASYALYLTHVFVMVAYAWLLQNRSLGQYSQVLLMPIVISVAIAIALLTHLLCERPVLAMIRRLTSLRPIPKIG
jgi:peptidoglycan/LPS O-acetylase OafA/YrhL